MLAALRLPACLWFVPMPLCRPLGVQELLPELWELCCRCYCFFHASSLSVSHVWMREMIVLGLCVFYQRHALRTGDIYTFLSNKKQALCSNRGFLSVCVTELLLPCQMSVMCLWDILGGSVAQACSWYGCSSAMCALPYCLWAWNACRRSCLCIAARSFIGAGLAIGLVQLFIFTTEQMPRVLSVGRRFTLCFPLFIPPTLVHSFTFCWDLVTERAFCWGPRGTLCSSERLETLITFLQVQTLTGAHVVVQLAFIAVSEGSVKEAE